MTMTTTLTMALTMTIHDGYKCNKNYSVIQPAECLIDTSINLIMIQFNDIYVFNLVIFASNLMIFIRQQSSALNMKCGN